MNSAMPRRQIAGLSHVLGATQAALLDCTIAELLETSAQRWPNQEAAVFCAAGIRKTYREFADDVDRFAGGLLRLNIAKGDRVGIWAPNSYEWLLCQFATARIGAILVCINPAYRVNELEFVLQNSGCTAVVMASTFKRSDYVGMMNALVPELAGAIPGKLRSDRVPELRSVICMARDAPAGMFGFDELCEIGASVKRDELDSISRALTQHDVINIQFTSGTTGKPKGACLTHHNIINNANFVLDTIAATDADRICVPVPFYHCFGMVLGTLGCVCRGATMVVPGPGFDASETLAAIAAERCTAVYGVPTMFVAELALPDFERFDLSSLRTGIMGGAPCPIEVMKKVRTLMHMHGVTIAYGMTETSPISFQTSMDDPIEKRVSTVGRVHPHVEVKIVDEQGNLLPTGEIGELLTRGYSIMSGYWQNPEKTAECLDTDGWMHTGDLATIDDDGYCSIVGRIKDMIKRGGESIYPKEIEDVLFTHPDIQQAQVFGIPDQKYGELVCAWIVPRDGATLSADAVKSFCKEQFAHFKVPAHVFFKETLPMTVSGKPQKFIMREMTLEELSPTRPGVFAGV